jgi:hypothetical protein
LQQLTRASGQRPKATELADLVCWCDVMWCWMPLRLC